MAVWNRPKWFDFCSGTKVDGSSTTDLALVLLSGLTLILGTTAALSLPLTSGSCSSGAATSVFSKSSSMKFVDKVDRFRCIRLSLGSNWAMFPMLWAFFTLAAAITSAAELFDRLTEIVTDLVSPVSPSLSLKFPFLSMAIGFQLKSDPLVSCDKLRFQLERSSYCLFFACLFLRLI